MPMVRPPCRSRPTALYADGQECRSQCMSGEIGARLVRAWCELGASLVRAWCELGARRFVGDNRGGPRWGMVELQGTGVRTGKAPPVRPCPFSLRSVARRDATEMRDETQTATEMRDETQTATEMRDETRKCPAARRAGPCYGRIDSAN